MNAILRAVCCAAVALLVAAAGAAEQTGEIRGVVTDETGSVLPGVLVSARGPSLQGLRTADSDARGSFRLPLLPVGRYDLTFELGGFERTTLTGTEARLGYTSSLAVTLRLAAFQEQVTVTAATPLIDRTRSDTSYRLSGEGLGLIPTQARTIAEVVALTPGVTGVRTDTVTGTDTGLPSFRGEGDAGNNWLVDGLSTKGVMWNDAGVRVNYDAWDEVEVISDGFEPALGQAVGGFVNIVTKSGGNAFHGEAGTLVRDDALRAGQEPQLSAASVPATSLAQYWANFGGPLRRDRLWFFLSDNYFASDETSSEQAIGWLTIPAGEHAATTNNVFGKLTSTPRTNHTLSLGGTFDTSLEESGGIGVPELYTETTHSDTAFRANYMGILSADTLLTAAAGQNRRENRTAPASGDYGPASYYWEDIAQRTHNVAEDFSTSERRTDLAVALSRVFDLRRWGRHEVKVGGSFYDNASRATETWTGRDADTIPDNGFDDGVGITWIAPGTPRELHEYQDGVVEDSTQGYGAHLQDSVTIGRATFMVGLRTDTQRVLNDAGEELWSWGAGDFLQPRAALAVDLGGDGHTVLKAAYGKFAMPMATAAMTFFNRTMVPAFRLYGWVGPENPTDTQLQDPANWEFQFEQSSTATPEEIDPEVEPDKLERVLIGLERQLAANWALRIRGVYSRSRNLLEDIGVYAPETPSGLKWVFTNFEEKRRDYRALELELNRRLAGGFALNASYTWSRASGTSSGNSFERGTWSFPWGGPHDASPFGDHPAVPASDPNQELYDELFGGLGGRGIGDEGWYGRLPYDVEHDVKILATCLAPYDVRISASLEWLSGYAWEKKGFVPAYGGFFAFPEQRGSRTTPDLTYVDLAVEKEFALGKGLGLAVGLNVYNLFDSQQPVSYVKEDNDLFGQVWARQLPRWVQLKLGLRF
jgi:hypothetical protein